MFIVWIFLYLFFTHNLDMHTARLDDLSAIQPLDTAVQVALEGTYLNAWLMC